MLYFNRERFDASSTIRFDLLIKDNPAFFTYDVSIMAYVGKIRAIDDRIRDIFDDLPEIAINQYIQKSLIDEIEFTNQIEAVISTRKDIHNLINEIERRIKTKKRFKGIVNKYVLLTEEKYLSSIQKILDNYMMRCYMTN